MGKLFKNSEFVTSTWSLSLLIARKVNLVSRSVFDNYRFVNETGKALSDKQKIGLYEIIRSLDHESPNVSIDGSSGHFYFGKLKVEWVTEWPAYVKSNLSVHFSNILEEIIYIKKSKVIGTKLTIIQLRSA